MTKPKNKVNVDGNHSTSTDEWRLLASKGQLDAADVICLVSWNQSPLGLGDCDGTMWFSEEGFRIHDNLIDPHALSLKSPAVQANILQFKRDYLLPLPCTPRELVEWCERNNEQGGWVDVCEDDASAADVLDLIALPEAFVLAVQNAAVNDAHAESKPEGEADIQSRAPLQRQQFQEVEILQVLVELGHTATTLPSNISGKPGVKAEARAKLTFTTSVFDKAWERLSATNQIAYETK